MLVDQLYLTTPFEQQAELVESGHRALQHHAIDEEQGHPLVVARRGGQKQVLERRLAAIGDRGGRNEVRRRLSEFVRRAYRQRLFISTQGSYSARVDSTSFVITPYELDRGVVDVQDLVLAAEMRAIHSACYAPEYLSGMRTVSCLRPFFRRRASVARPHFVSMRARNPCVLSRRVLRGPREAESTV